MSAGPLSGVRVIEFAGIGPIPYAATLLADMGADVVRIDRVSGGDWPQLPIISRGRTSLQIDLKDPADVATCLAAIERADVLIEGFRPGVMERLGLGPDAALARNPRLVYGRITGWGQNGPMAKVAGHDINYLALAGALQPLGATDGPPIPPLNLLGDYAGGSLFLVHGVLAALFERERSGLGQVIDAAIVDGAASLMGPVLGMAATGLLTLDRQGNILGGVQAPHYRCYPCADGRHVAVGPLEPRFRRALLDALGLTEEEMGDLDDPANWAAARDRIAAAFATRPRDAWAADFGMAEMCLTPVLSPDEAAGNAHMQARGSYISDDAGLTQPAAAPRFSRSAGSLRTASAQPGVGGAETLAAWSVPIPTETAAS